jgi:peptidyl-prolyl cis-trans isomerase B (cyclophilin B)
VPIRLPDVIRTPMIVVTLLASLAVLTGCADDPNPGAGGNTTEASPDESGCAQVEAPEPKPDGGETGPDTELDPTQTNTVTFSTSCGNFTVTLDADNAATTSASVAALARSGFYDNTAFHRIVPGFVIQGGDPTGTGGGGPGYKTVDAPPSDASYTSGVVAMAKTADEPAGTSGSQFFVVTAADSGLPPDYAIIGKVTKGMDTVKRIEALGTANEQPSRPVVLEKATFSAK